MYTLPPSDRLPVHHLAAVYDNVTNSYKFLWFLAILDEIEENSGRILPISRLLGRMIASAWYPVNYFRISFGKQDILARFVTELLARNLVPLHARNAQVSMIVAQEIASGSGIGQALTTLVSYVPYRFIRPFFAKHLRGMVDAQVNRTIMELAAIYFERADAPSLYRFCSADEAAIELHPLWFDYIQRHIVILRGYSYWHFLTYLQQRNPGVPGLATKLFAPQARNLTLARRFWRIALEKLGNVRCIYSGMELEDNYSLDHFLPWRFVAHDSLWNIVPTPRSVNSAKGDCLPDFPTYFVPFAQLQFFAMQAVVATGGHTTLLEDYSMLLATDSISTLASISLTHFQQALHATLAPQVQIAINLGFQHGWTY